MKNTENDSQEEISLEEKLHNETSQNKRNYDYSDRNDGIMEKIDAMQKDVCNIKSDVGKIKKEVVNIKSDMYLKKSQETEEDEVIESMETMILKAFQGQQGDEELQKEPADHPVSEEIQRSVKEELQKHEDLRKDNEGYEEDDEEDEVPDDDDVEAQEDRRPSVTMMTGLLNMALGAEMMGGLEPVEEADEDKPDSAMASSRDDDADVVAVEADFKAEDVLESNVEEAKAGDVLESKAEEDDNEVDEIDEITKAKKEKHAFKEQNSNEQTSQRKERTEVSELNVDADQAEPKIVQDSPKDKYKPEAGSADLDDLKEDVRSLKNDFQAMQKDVHYIKTDVGEIKKDVKGMNKNIKSDMRVLKDAFSGLREGTMASSGSCFS